MKKTKRQSRSSKAAKRFALTLALLGLFTNVSHSQSGLPSLPDSLPASKTGAELPMLPFPFAPAGSLPSTPSQQSSSPHVEMRVVGILGLTPSPSAATAAKAMPDLAKPKSVVQQETKLILPSPVPGPINAHNPIALANASQVVEAAESLIDVEIPIPGGTKAAAESGTRLTLSDKQPEALPAPSEHTPQIVKKGKALSLNTANQEQSSKTMDKAVAHETPPLKGIVDLVAPANPPLPVEPTLSKLPKKQTEFRISDNAEPLQPTMLSLNDNAPHASPEKLIENDASLTRASTNSKIKPALSIATMPTFSPDPVPVAAAARRVEAQLASSVSAPRSLLNSDDIRNATVGTALVVRHQDVIPIKAGGTIVEYSTEHPAVCKLIKTSDNTLSLVGLTTGETRIAIVTETKSDGRRIEICDVQVGDGSDPRFSLQALASEISQTTARLYPKSRVEVVAYGEQLVVQGLVQNESEARKVLSLVRKTAFCPVIDRLQSDGK